LATAAVTGSAFAAAVTLPTLVTLGSDAPPESLALPAAAGNRPVTTVKARPLESSTRAHRRGRIARGRAGANTPFSGGIKQQITYRGSPNTDYDVGFIFDYDRDPTHSPDLMVADGNDSAGYYVIADRQSTLYVDCGVAASGILDLGSLLTAEMVVTAARITPETGLLEAGASPRTMAPYAVGR